MNCWSLAAERRAAVAVTEYMARARTRPLRASADGEIFNRYFRDGLTRADLAYELGISLDAAKARVANLRRRAVAWLRGRRGTLAPAAHERGPQ